MSNLLNNPPKGYSVKRTLAPSDNDSSPDSLSIESLSVEDLSWWLEITTNKPYCVCVYCFGPFDGITEAASYHEDYIKDSRNEGVAPQEITSIIRRCKPEQLTVFDEALGC